MSEEGNEALPDSVDPDQARELVAGGRVRVIDVRSAEDYAAERISGSVHAEPDELEGGVEADGVGRDAVLVVCADGERSAEIAAKLRDEGTDATSIEGGFEAWADDGKPTAPGSDEEYEGPKVTLPGAVSSSGEDDDEEKGDEDG
jgi:rhodanese-related sulfurtransferase